MPKKGRFCSFYHVLFAYDAWPYVMTTMARKPHNNLTNMKSTLTRLTIMTSVVLSLFVVSCGKKDTADSLSDELVANMGELVAAIDTAKDRESAEKAATKIGEIGDEFTAIAKRMDALGDPSEEDKKLVGSKRDKAEDEMKEKMMATMETVMANPEVAPIIGKAMEDFGNKMDEADKTFNKYGK